MYTPHIVLFGGQEKVIDQVKNLLGKRALLKRCRMEDAAVFSLAQTGASLFLLLPSKNDLKALGALSALRTQFPDIPRVVLAPAAVLEEVDDYIHAGCSRFLVFPKYISRLTDLLPTEPDPPAAALPSRSRNPFTGGLLDMINQVLSVGLVPRTIARIMQMDAPAPPLPTGMRAQLLGNFEVAVAGKPMPELKGKKLKSLLAYLLCQAPRQVHKNTLADLFWGDTETAANSLQVAICQLRRQLREATGCADLICHENERYFIHPDYPISSDAGDFRTHWQNGQLAELRAGLEEALPAYHKAIGCYHGEFMEDLGRHCEPWVAQERESLTEKYLHTLERMGVYFFREGNPVVAINLCQRILEKAPCFETAYRLLMICYEQAGQRGHAIATYQKCAAALWEAYKVKPSAETEMAYRDIVAAAKPPFQHSAPSELFPAHWVGGR